nr:PAS domain-containing protein [Acidobacteriota bacterium]
ALSRIAPYNIEHRVVRPDGDERIVSEIGEVSFDESGKPHRFIGTVQDITERKADETEMQLMKRALTRLSKASLYATRGCRMNRLFIQMPLLKI